MHNYIMAELPKKKKQNTPTYKGKNRDRYNL